MRYICRICGYVYDDAVEKQPFSALPDSWKCPICGATKADFAQEATNSAPQAPEHAPGASFEAHEHAELSFGQLAALCSNLARGCAKMYMAEAAEQYTRLADYFSSIAPQVNDPTVERLLSSLEADVSAYAALRQTSDQASDRGAARVCVWGEKVTRMLSSLVSRYIAEGEGMLASQRVWLCTVCGFVFIGEKPPELCPVCKVPSWKFEQVEGRNGA